MRILVLGINYTPEKTSVAPFTTGLCEHLVQNGHSVKVVTACPYYPGWKVFDEYRGSRYRREEINGVDVQRVWHFVPSRPSSLVQRLAHDLSFTVIAFVAALLSGKCDVIYCSCPPPTLAVAAYLLGKIKGAPFAIKLTDLASEAALATGILQEGVALRMARKLESFVYGRACAVVCLCQGFVDSLIRGGTARGKLRLIPDWGDTERIRPLENSSSFRAEHNIPIEEFLVLHTGNMGKKQGLVNAVKAAELIPDAERVLLLLVGDGEERALLEQELAARAPHKVRMLPLQPVQTLAEMYAAADVLLLNQLSTVEGAVIPSKLLTYMAAGRPVLTAATARSESALHVLRAGCGLVVQPDDPQALADAVLQLAGDAQLRQKLGANGRAYAEVHFTKRAVLEQYDLFFAEIAASGPGPLLEARAVPSR